MKKVNYYILNDEGNPVAEPDIDKWQRWYATADRSVARTIIGNTHVSTIFLAYGVGDDGPPLWETAILGGNLGESTHHCTGNREQAQAMHEEAVARVKRLNQ